ncbi:MAG: thioesterase family protein [Gammaproteobacteria bacterium]
MVKPEWLDPNGHMNVAYYLRAVDDGSNSFFDDIGLGWAYTASGVGSVFVANCNLDFKQELFVRDALIVTTRLLDWHTKLLHTYSEVVQVSTEAIAATCETLYMHVDFSNRRGAPMPAAAQARLAEILAAHATLPRPTNLNRSLGIRR